MELGNRMISISTSPPDKGCLVILNLGMSCFVLFDIFFCDMFNSMKQALSLDLPIQQSIVK
jgi:hypothetical protein